MGFSDIIQKANMAKDKLLQKFSHRTEFRSILGDISGILDPQDMEVIVVRGKNCDIVYTNARAEERLIDEEGTEFTCRAVYSRHFPGLCENCPYGGKTDVADGIPFEIEDKNGRLFVVRRNTLNWADGKPATIFMMRDVTPEKEANDRLYMLAYVDQLTGVPNRQKLKEDFTALEDKITNFELSGIIALFDLDHFKTVNDTYGHNTGDVVLRRLTEHLQENPDFKDKLYRLGGDEFIIFMTNPASRFETLEALQAHYVNILSGALRAYTLPNIDVKCTLSIGVSCFPKHGATLSDLLRKADIALYQAKEAGRNQILLFEDHYDKAQKFKDMYINIQPVLLSAGKTFGYELIDRSQSDEDDEEGTITLSEFNRTLDALGLGDLENNLHYFITYSKQLLSPTVLRNLPREKFIVQMSLPGKTSKTSIQQDIKLYNELRDNGYKLALIGLDSGAPVTELLAIADYCKFTSSDKNLVRQKILIAKNQRVRFIATNIDTMDDYQAAKDAGFHMFQGFYFNTNTPVVGRKTKEVSPLKVNYFRLMQLSSTEDYMDFKEISNVIASDVALSYKLLRILNSAAVGLRNVSSIAAAVAYMGEESLKKWIAVLALRGIAEDKPLELVRMSLIRARFGEVLAPCFRIKRNPQQVFMVGMLSLLHIAMDMTREELLEDIPVTEEIRSSLLTRTGIYSDLLRFYENYEYANWDAVSQFVEENQLDSTMVSDTYISAVKWYNDLASN